MCHQQAHSKEMLGEAFQADRKTEQRGAWGFKTEEEEGNWAAENHLGHY